MLRFADVTSESNPYMRLPALNLFWRLPLGVVVLCLAAAAAQAQVVAPGDMVVTLVGTGGPELTPERQGMSTLVQAEGQALLFDAGRGTLDGLYRARVMPQTVTRIFLTHLHSDHIAGLPDLWMTPWFLLGRKTPLEIWGPVGTQAMVDGMRQMYDHDLSQRPNAALDRSWLDIRVREVQPGVLYKQGGVTVTATLVHHDDGDPAYAYRVDTAKRSVFLTGDCRMDESLLLGSRGVDLLIANVVAGTPAMEATERMKPILAKLMPPEQAAAVFLLNKPRLAVYSHIVKKGLPGEAGDAMLVRRTRSAGYSGPLVVGADGMRIAVGKMVEVLPKVSGALPDLDGPGARF